MSAPFLAEIRMWGCNFAPKGWAFCDGQTLAISQNTALFSLIGTYYGGDGKSNFRLPYLDGASPMFWGQAQGGSLYSLGEDGGSETVTLVEGQVPAHNHALQAEARPATSNAKFGPAEKEWLLLASSCIHRAGRARNDAGLVSTACTPANRGPQIPNSKPMS